MKRCSETRYLISAALAVFVATNHAAADYLRLKVDLNNVTLFPQMPMGNAQGNQGGAGMLGGGPIRPPGPLGFGGTKGSTAPGNNAGNPEAAAPLWVSVYLEVKGKWPPPPGAAIPIDHQWGKTTYIPNHPKDQSDKTFLLVEYLPREPLKKEHDRRLKKLLKDGAGAKELVKLAFWDWSHGLLKQFHETVDELKKVDSKHSVVSKYAGIQNQLKAPLTQEDPAARSYLEELRADKYRSMVSDKGHYTLYFNLIPIPANDAQIKRRLARLEESLESFYYWFAFQDNVPVPPMPRYRLLGQLINDPEDFLKKHKSWGTVPMLADGFTPRRDNIMILSAKRVDDAYTFLVAKNQEWQRTQSVNHDELVSGDVWKHKQPNMTLAVLQTMSVIQKAMEEESERATLSHEAVRQLLAATGLLPRNVAAPEWVQDGLASYFETPLGAVYGSGGLPSWSNLVPFKHHKSKSSGKAREVLMNVLSDHYFQVARAGSAEEEPGEPSEKVQEDWERARATAWSFVYYLNREQKMDRLFRFIDELGQMPRDLELEPRVLEACFAKAFALGSLKNALKADPAKLQELGDSWFAGMETESLELPEVEKEARRPHAPAPKKSGPGPKGSANPMVPPPPGGM
jgi:hypothetical protein